MPASLVDLNEDVLLVIVSFLDPSSARQLSQTARAVHIIAKHRALECVTLTSFKKAGQFCEYMLKDMPYRLSSLRELRLLTALPQPMPDTIFYHIAKYTAGNARLSRESRLLMSMLANTPNLRVLVMHSAEYWIAHAPQLAEVLASLRNLQEIELENAGPLTGQFINTTQAKPRSLAFLNEQWFPHEARHPLVLRTTLCLPSVEYLAAYDPVHQPGDMRDFALSFPAVKRLDILRIPRFIQDRDARLTVNWPSLERVRGSVFSFDWKTESGVHFLQLINRLSTTDINRHALTRRLSEEGGGPVACTSAISAILNVQPVALVMHMDVTAECLRLKLIVRSSRRLRYLAVALDDLQRPNIKVDWWWAAFCHGLVESRIVCLEVRLPDSRIPEDGQAIIAPDSKEAIRYKRAVARMFSLSAKLLPQSLRYLSLDLRPRGQSPWRYNFLAPQEEQTISTPPDLHWWSVKGEGDSRSMEPLDAEKGERIAAYMRSVEYDHTRSLHFEQDIQGL